MRIRRGPIGPPPGPPGLQRRPPPRMLSAAVFDNDDEEDDADKDDDDFDANPRPPVPIIDPDNFDIISITSRKNR